MIHATAQTTIAALLSKNDSGTEYHYIIPPYQREYSWNKTQWDNLFDDLLDNDEGYFLGSIICILGEKADKVTEATVIDGQQRLTTLNLLLLAMYDKINPLKKHDIVMENDEYIAARLATKKYFLNGEIPRLTPSIQNNNGADYAYLVRLVAQENDINKPSNWGNRRVAKAFQHFTDRIEKYAGNDVHMLFGLLRKIVAALIVRIDTQDEASAFILFESVNNRGVPLTPMDLIKNSMISSLKSQSAEQTNQQWQQIVNNLSDYDVQVRYLRHFYQAFKPIGLIFNENKGKEKITKADLIQIYTTVIKQQPENVLRQLTAKSLTYQILSYPENLTQDNSLVCYKNQLSNLKKLGVASAYTLLLFLFEHYPEQNFGKLLSYLEQWFMVRHLTAIPASNRLDDIFIAATKTQHHAYNENTLIAELKKHLPTMDYIKQALQSQSLYDDNPALIRYILVYLEQQQRTAENAVNFWALYDNGKPVWSVEHIYPQNPKKDEWTEDCQEWLHSFGNLTLTAYNSNLSNRSFVKKSYVNENGKEIGLKSGNVKINDYLLDKNEWNAEHIEKRGNELIDAFLNSLQS